MKNKRIPALYAVLIMAMLIGSMSKLATFVSLAVSFVISVVIAIEATKDKDSEICIQIILALILQNLCIGIGAHIASNSDDSLKYITQIPFMNILCLWMVLQLKMLRERISKSKLLFVIFTCAIAVSSIIDHGTIQAILMNIRNMTVFYMLYEIGKYYITDKKEFEAFVIKYNKTLNILLAAGVILLICGYDLYEKIGIKEVYIAKGNPITAGVLHPRFYTTIFSHSFLRMGSIYYEPVNLAYLYASGLLINLFYKTDSKVIRSRRYLNILTSTAGLILTFGKGGFLIAFCGIAFVLLNKLLKNLTSVKENRSIFKISSAIIIIITALICLYGYNNAQTSANPHFWAIEQTWANVKKRPLGYGLGTGGNMAYVFNENATMSYSANSKWLSSGGESAIFSFMYQIGIPGTILLIACILSIAKNVDDKNSTFLNLVKMLPIILLCIGVMQENTFTPQCIAPFMLVVGACTDGFKEKSI